MPTAQVQIQRTDSLLQGAALEFSVNASGHALIQEFLVLNELVFFENAYLLHASEGQFSEAVLHTLAPRAFVGGAVAPHHFTLAMALVVQELTVVAASGTPYLRAETHLVIFVEISGVN